MTTQRDSDLRAERRAAERAAARRLHPDLGGDPERYIAAMRRIAAQYDGPPAADETFQGFSRSRHWSRVRRTARRVAREARAAVPTGWPGARKYGRL